MTSTPTRMGSKLDATALRVLAGRRGPFVTIQYPGYHPGASEIARRTMLRDLIRSARERLSARPLGAYQSELADSLTQVALDAERLRAGGPGGVIFCAPNFVAEYSRHGPFAEHLTIASHPYLTPFLAEALAPQEFLILDLNRKRLRLIDYAYGDCTERAWPASIPPNLKEFGGFDQPDHDLENRSAAGVSTGAMRAVHFGTLSDREAAGEHLHHFFAAVDRGLKTVLQGRLLLLAGVREEAAAYRRAPKTNHLLRAEITGNLEFVPLSEIAVRAKEAALAHYYEMGENVLATVAEMPDRKRALTDVHDVLKAAAAGRAHQLCVREDTHILERLDAEVDATGLDAEDLINAAVVETLRAGGDVFALPTTRMTAANPVAAILRY